MYEKIIHELELTIGRYRYLEEIGKQYKTKFASLPGKYTLSIDPCLYNTTPEFGFTIKRNKPNGNILFRITAHIKFIHDTNHFIYVINLYNGRDRSTEYPNETRLMEHFEELLNEDMKKVAKEDQKKILDSIDNLPG